MNAVSRNDDGERLALALAGDLLLLRQLIAEWLPIVRARVVRAIRRHLALARDPKQEVEDLAQEVFAMLFADEAKILRSWVHERGLSLPNYVGLVAERHASAIMKSRRKSPWTESPATSAEFEMYLEADDRSSAMETRDLLGTLLSEIEEALSPRGLELFELLILRDEPVEDVSTTTGMTIAATYAWRKRLLKVARLVGQALMQKASCARMRVAPDVSACQSMPAR